MSKQFAFGDYLLKTFVAISTQAGRWGRGTIVETLEPYFKPTSNFIRYAGEIFEGMKITIVRDTIFLFRPKDHYERFCISAEIMAVRVPSYDLFLEGIIRAVKSNYKEIKALKTNTIYVAPYIVNSYELGPIPNSGDQYTYVVSLCPLTFPENPMGMKVKMEHEHVRAFPGGIGQAKAGANYAIAKKPMKKAKKEGYDILLWKNPVTGYLDEFSTMNLFYVLDNGHVITPKLGDTIIHGVTRRTTIQLLKDANYHIQEVDTLASGFIETLYKKKIVEVFGTGTASMSKYATSVKCNETHTIELASLDVCSFVYDSLQKTYQGKTHPELSLDITEQVLDA